jgi:hypothetical protein
MRNPMIAISLMLIASTAAEEVVQVVDWPKGERALENTTGGPRTLPVTVLHSPKIASSRYALKGSLRHEGVVGRAYLEMWSVFRDGSRFFTRTLADAGPMAPFQGSGGPREFVLPFTNREGGPAPVRLEVNAVFAGPGRIHLGPLQLVQMPTGLEGAWWSERDTGWLGAIAGCVLGLWGALVGILASRGRARRFVLSALAVGAALGAACLAAGLVAVALSQPWFVAYPLLLIGVLETSLGAAGYVWLRRRYVEQELRRMDALDAA